MSGILANLLEFASSEELDIPINIEKKDQYYNDNMVCTSQILSALLTIRASLNQFDEVAISYEEYRTEEANFYDLEFANGTKIRSRSILRGNGWVYLSSKQFIKL